MKSFKTFFEETAVQRSGAVITFGRYNPPTKGHERLFNKAAEIKNKLNYEMYIFASHTQNNKKDPLEYSIKLECMKEMFPRYSSSIYESDSIRDIISAVRFIESQGYDHLIVVTGQDRLSEYKNLLEKYNHKEYSFDSIKVISSGDRDPDSANVNGVSASKARQAALEGNYKSFQEMMPNRLSESTLTNLYDSVREGLGLQTKGTIHLDRSDEREKFYSGNLFNEGDRVEIKKTGEEGTIAHIGANYVIVERKGKKTRHWPNDLKVKTPGAGEEGTDELVKRYKKDTPGQSMKEAITSVLNR